MASGRGALMTAPGAAGRRSRHAKAPARGRRPLAPATGPPAAAVEALAVGKGRVRCSVIGAGHCRHDRTSMGRHHGVAFEDVIPALLVEYHQTTIGIDDL